MNIKSSQTGKEKGYISSKQEMEGEKTVDPNLGRPGALYLELRNIVSANIETRQLIMLIPSSVWVQMY